MIVILNWAGLDREPYHDLLLCEKQIRLWVFILKTALYSGYLGRTILYIVISLFRCRFVSQSPQIGKATQYILHNTTEQLAKSKN